jgi:hypothetical protein
MSAKEVTYEDVQKLADKLSREDQERLIDHLYEVRRRSMNAQEWMKRFEETMIDAEVIGQIFDRREDFYDDDGR